MTSVINTAILEQLKDILGDDIGLVLNSFLQEGADVVDKIENAMPDGDLNAVREAAHSMKSMAGNVGAIELSDLADKLQVSAANGDAELSQTLWVEFQEQYELAAKEIENFS